MFVRGRPSPISHLKTLRDTLLDVIFQIRLRFYIVLCFVLIRLTVIISISRVRG